MGTRKIILSLFLIQSLIVSNLFAGEYEDWLASQNKEYTTYQKSINEEFKAYKKAFNEELKSYKKDLIGVWGEADITTKTKVVSYSPNLKEKKVVDFKNKKISLEVIATNKKEAEKKLEKMFKEITEETVKDVNKKDILEKRVYKRLKKVKPVIKSNKFLIADIIKKKEKAKMFLSIKKNITVVKKGNKFIYKTTAKLPATSIVRKAKVYSSEVKKNASKQKIPASLVYAIMQSESSFNPLARSHIPAYGLMQLVPRTAGMDSYKYLYNRKKLLTSSYLYNENNNITLGSAYLHILYYSYLRKITNPQTKIYCTIAAYNTGAGNIAKTFTGKYNINKASKIINKMTPDEVYNKLLRNLPYTETRHYLKKVSSRMNSYQKAIKRGQL
jgi:membrane-bound lytic murein transglycosylase C